MIAALALLAALPLAEPGVLARVEAAWPDIHDAADAYQLDPHALAALLVVESRCAPVVGGWRDAMIGPGQIHWPIWAAGLLEAGVVDERDDLLRQREGIHATAWVLRSLLDQGLGGERALCAYNAGLRGLRQPRCEYSRIVLAVRDQIRRTR